MTIRAQLSNWTEALPVTLSCNDGLAFTRLKLVVDLDETRVAVATLHRRINSTGAGFDLFTVPDLDLVPVLREIARCAFHDAGLESLDGVCTDASQFALWQQVLSMDGLVRSAAGVIGATAWRIEHAAETTKVGRALGRPAVDERRLCLHIHRTKG